MEVDRTLCHRKLSVPFASPDSPLTIFTGGLLKPRTLLTFSVRRFGIVAKGLSNDFITLMDALNRQYFSDGYDLTVLFARKMV